jgi:hypothetical protein
VAVEVEAVADHHHPNLQPNLKDVELAVIIISRRQPSTTLNREMSILIISNLIIIIRSVSIRRSTSRYITTAMATTFTMERMATMKTRQIQLRRRHLQASRYFLTPAWAVA